MVAPEEKADLLDVCSPGQVLALGMGGVALSYVVAGLFFQQSTEAPIHVVTIVANLIGMVAVPLLYMRGRRVAVATSLRLDAVPAPQLLWVLGMVVASLPAVLAIGGWNQNVSPPPPEYFERIEDLLADTPGKWLLSILSIVIVAPVAEEIVFRGMIQQAARRVIGPWPGIVFTAVTFAIWHGQVWNLGALIAVGFLFGVVFEATGSLRASMAAHAGYNLIVLLLYHFGVMVPDLDAVTTSTVQRIALSFGPVLALLVAWAAYGRLRNVVPWPEPPSEDER